MSNINFHMYIRNINNNTFKCIAECIHYYSAENIDNIELLVTLETDINDTTFEIYIQSPEHILNVNLDNEIGFLTTHPNSSEFNIHWNNIYIGFSVANISDKDGGSLNIKIKNLTPETKLSFKNALYKLKKFMIEYTKLKEQKYEMIRNLKIMTDLINFTDN